MKFKPLYAALRSYLALGVAVNSTTYPQMASFLPPNMVADNSALFGVIGGLNNLVQVAAPELIAVNGAASVTVTLTVAQFYSFIVDYTGTAAGGVALTTPTAAQIIAAAPPTMPRNGFNFFQLIMNDGSGQTVTYTAGAGVTLSATTATLANNTSRMFFINVNINAGTVNIIAIGGGLTL